MRRSEIVARLPDVFERTADVAGSPLDVLVEVIERMHAPSEAALDRLDEYFDPRRAAEQFVPYLAGWVDLAWLLLDNPDANDAPVRSYPPGLGRLREVVATAAERAKWRGTMQGLVGLLEAATGLSGFGIDEDVRADDGRPLPFRIRLHAPAAAERYALLIRRIAEHEKPAHIVLDSDIIFSGR